MSEPSTNIIEVKDLVKTFGNFTAVGGLSFSVKRGEIFSFLGPNGAGKTTTIKMLTTLLRPDSGSIRIAGLDPAREPLEVRRRFGIVFQDNSLDDELTAWENMFFHTVLYGVPADERRARIEDMLRFVGLWDRRQDLVKHFSGGMKRRLEIARCLSHQPDLIFLDEPTSGLDPQNRSRLWEHLRRLNFEMGTTIFLTTHSMEEAEKVSQRIIVIDGGKIAAEGAPDDIKRQTETQTLEEAFLTLTGRDLRDDVPGSLDSMRRTRAVWKGKGK
ncbi:MAG TPA: ATP-binding cassette domain-containing protein [Elusimicrobiota bacterium]|nr:ATP-binding cassette domain-containing protein [Elusimicrobiota bacterium]